MKQSLCSRHRERRQEVSTGSTQCLDQKTFLKKWVGLISHWNISGWKELQSGVLQRTASAWNSGRYYQVLTEQNGSKGIKTSCKESPKNTKNKLHLTSNYDSELSVKTSSVEQLRTNRKIVMTSRLSGVTFCEGKTFGVKLCDHSNSETWWW